MSKRLLAAIVAVAGLAAAAMQPVVAHAQPRTDLDRALSSIEQLDCPSVVVDNRDYGGEGATAIVALSAWTGRTVDAMLRDAGLGEIADAVREQGIDVEAVAAIRRVADLLYRANGEAVARMTGDIAAYGPAFCPIVRAVVDEPILQILTGQGSHPAFYHGYIRSVQQLARLHGCSEAEIDGVFAPPTQSAWDAVAAGLDAESLRGRMPTPGDLAALASVAAVSGACDAGKRTRGAAFASIGLLFAGYDGDLMGWLDMLDTGRPAMLDALAASGEWTPYQQRLAMQATVVEEFVRPGVQERLVADIYARGIGVKADPAAAAFWRGLAGPTDYERYRAGLGDASAARGAVDAFVRREVDAGEATRSGALAGPFGVLLSDAVRIGQRGSLARLAHLVQRHGAALDALLASPAASLKLRLAERIMEGASVAGRDAGLAARLLRSAAEDGSAHAASRLAFMTAHGLGVAADAGAAMALARGAAGDGEPFAAWQVARMTEAGGDEGAAIDRYRAALEAAESFDGHALYGRLVANRLLAGSEALASPAGRAMLAGVAARVPSIARSLGEANLCTGCGGLIDPAEAARWLRMAHDAGEQAAGRTLARLLLARPELAQSPGEALARLRANVEPPRQGDSLFGPFTDIASYLMLAAEEARAEGGPDAVVDTMTARLGEICGQGDVDCEKAAVYYASGRLDPRLIAPGIERLRTLDSIYLVDILAAYGDFPGALEAARREPYPWKFGDIIPSRNSVDGDVSNERAATLRRLMAERAPQDMRDLPPTLEPLLRFLALQGDVEAGGYLRAMSRDRPPPRRLEVELADARASYDRVAAQGGLGRPLANAARTLSRAHAAAGDREEALSFELTALSAELRLDEIGALSAGPLQGGLSRTCHLSRSSERVFDLGFDDVAMVLAKDAVNALQRIRRDLAGVPEELQGCFRDLVAGHYRWLADLFIRQQRLPEAEFVLGLLKDFEAFQFVDRDEGFEGRSYEPLPLSVDETALSDAVAALSPPSVPDARRGYELRLKRAREGLTGAEEAEFAAIRARLAEADKAYREAMAAILAAAGRLGRGDRAAQLAGLGPLQAHLRTEVSEPVATIHYLVLPDRMSLILTTPYERRSHVWTEWEGAPFTEQRLDAAVAAFHRALADPAIDPRPLGRRLYALMLAPFEAELRANEVELVLLSLDRRLRYVPVAALYDGERFAVERFAFSMLTDAGYEIAGERVSGIPVAALGMTQAADGFNALPGVGIELDGLVRGDDGFGLMEGRVLLDAAFDRIALEDALLIGADDPAGMGIVHISSHFHLGRSDGQSFLLLGTGDRLALDEIKGDGFAFDFGHVDLLTLSACSTGYANPALDGRELESLAYITGDRGARSILASLWPVEDRMTAILMQRFYELRERGGYSKARAMALAQREFITGRIGSRDHLDGDSIVFETAIRGAVSLAGGGRPDPHGLGRGHPFYWAPFVLTGNWR